MTTARITVTVPSFPEELFKYITTIVPYWRVNDEAWLLGEDNLVGVGVGRNYGGQVMVLPWDGQTRDQLQRFRQRLGPLAKRIIVVVDDRDLEDLEAVRAMAAPIEVLAWSHRANLASFVVKDFPD